MACSEDVHFPSPYFPSPHRVAFKRKGLPRSGGAALDVQVALRNRSLPNRRGPSSGRRQLAPQGATAGDEVCAEHTWPSQGLAIIDSLPHLRQPEAPSGGDPATARSIPSAPPAPATPCGWTLEASLLSSSLDGILVEARVALDGFAGCYGVAKNEDKANNMCCRYCCLSERSSCCSSGCFPLPPCVWMGSTGLQQHHATPTDKGFWFIHCFSCQ